MVTARTKGNPATYEALFIISKQRCRRCGLVEKKTHYLTMRKGRKAYGKYLYETGVEKQDDE